MTDLRWQFLSESARSILARYPYQWDLELLFTVLAAVWGIFLWESAETLDASRKLLQFTVVAFLTQGIATVILGLLRPTEIAHLLLDSVPWFVLGILLVCALKQSLRSG